LDRQFIPVQGQIFTGREVIHPALLLSFRSVAEESASVLSSSLYTSVIFKIIQKICAYSPTTNYLCSSPALPHEPPQNVPQKPWGTPVETAKSPVKTPLHHNQKKTLRKRKLDPGF
jgi:hypothetical protein